MYKSFDKKKKVDENYGIVRDSRCVTSIVFLSRVHQTEDLPLKSPKIMINKELQEVVSLTTL